VGLAHATVMDESLSGNHPEGIVRRADEESGDVLPFDGGPAERALRTQTVQVFRPDLNSVPVERQGWTVLAPVTERGETLGLLELSLPVEPDQRVLAGIVRTAHILGFVVIANRRHTDFFEWVSAVPPSPSRRRYSDACCPRRSPAKRARSPFRAGSNPRQT
jgi:hypothetical protein